MRDLKNVVLALLGLAAAACGMKPAVLIPVIEQDAGPSCTPDCTGKTCGDDGCGGSCGSCEWDNICVDGQCCAPDVGKACGCGEIQCGGACGPKADCPNPHCGEVCFIGERCSFINCDGICDPFSPCGPNQECIKGGHCGPAY